jgi:hypothetical protein
MKKSIKRKRKRISSPKATRLSSTVTARPAVVPIPNKPSLYAVLRCSWDVWGVRTTRKPKQEEPS